MVVTGRLFDTITYMSYAEKTKISDVSGDTINPAILEMQGGINSSGNSTVTPLSSGATFTGAWEQNNHPDALVMMKTDNSGTLYFDFSPDGVNLDSTFPSSGFDIASGTPEVHVARKGPRYFRVRYVNDSGAQSYFRLTTYYGTFAQLNTPLNGVVSRDSDAIVVRTFSEELSIAQGLFNGTSVVNKFGRNGDIDAGSVPEDIWNGGGVYTGFPTGTPEVLEVFSSSASDTGTFTFTYLASSTSTAYTTATVTLTGTTPVNTGITVYRMHTANYSSGTPTGLNVGTITARHVTTTANIFCVMPIGTSQTYVGAYTIPAGSMGTIRRFFVRVSANTSGTVEGGLWVRSLNGSPRIRRPFIASNTDNFEEQAYAGINFSAGTDIAVRVLNTFGTNNLEVLAGFDLVLSTN